MASTNPNEGESPGNCSYKIMYNEKWGDWDLWYLNKPAGAWVCLNHGNKDYMIRNMQEHSKNKDRETMCFDSSGRQI